MNEIRHIWFDFSQTIALENAEVHNVLRYKTYASLVSRTVSPELMQEYEELYKKYKSNSGVFDSLGLGAEYWSNIYSSFDPKQLLRLAEPIIPAVLNELRNKVSISLWSNVNAKKLLPALAIEPSWFTHILGPDEVRKPKPALDGFQLLIERSNLPAQHILFVGDSVEKEMRPAKSLGIQTGLMWIESPEADYCFKSFRDILAVVHSSRDGRL